MNLFGRYKKNKDYKTPLYEKHIAYAETDELKKMRQQIDSVGSKFGKKANLFAALELVVFVVSAVLIAFFIGAVKRGGWAAAFASTYVLFLIFGVLGIGLFVLLLIKVRPGKKLYTDIKSEIYTVVEDVDDYVERQLDFKYKDIKFKIEIDVVEPVYGKIGDEGKKPRNFNVDKKDFLIVNNRLLVQDGYNYLEIPMSDLRGVSIADEKFVLKYWPGDRGYNSKQYKNLKVRFFENKFYLKSTGIMELSGQDESYTVTFMPYEMGKAEYLLSKIARARAGENIKEDNNNLAVVGADFLNIQEEAAVKLKKAFGLKSGSKILLFGQPNLDFAAWLLEQGFVLDVGVASADVASWLAAELYGFENFRTMTLDEVSPQTAADAELLVVSQYLLSSTSFEQYKELALSLTSKAKNIAVVANMFGSLVKECPLLKELNDALTRQFDNYTPLGEREKVFEENLRSLNCLRGSENIRDEFPAAYHELSLMLDASFPKDLGDDEIKQINAAIKEVFVKVAEDELYDLPYNTVVYTSNSGSNYR